MRLSRASRWVLGALSVLILAVIYLPLAVVGVNSFNTNRNMVWPPPGFTVDWWGKAFNSLGLWDAVLTSVEVAIASTAVALVLGTLVAMALSRYKFFGRQVVSLLAHSTLLQDEDATLRLARLPMLGAALRSNPSLSAVYGGTARGNFLLLRRVEDEAQRRVLGAPMAAAYVLQSVQREPAADLQGEFLYLDAQLRPLERQRRPEYRFDPRDRPWFAQALALDPRRVCRQQLASPRIEVRFGSSVHRIARDESGWHAVAHTGEAIASAPVMVVATACDGAALVPHLPLQRVRGQVSKIGRAHV